MTGDQVFKVLYGNSKRVISIFVLISIAATITSVFMMIWYDWKLGLKIFVSGIFVFILFIMYYHLLDKICEEAATKMNEAKEEKKPLSEFQIRLKEMAKKRGIKFVEE